MIERRGNSWRARYRGPDRRERSKSFKRKSDAERWLMQQRSLMAQGDWTDPARGRITFGEYAEAWLESRADLKPKTRHQYQSLMRQYIMPTWRNVPLANIRAARSRLRLTQQSVSRRMRQLGYQWYPQTVGLVERNQRPLLADELAALALALETTPDVLFLPPHDAAQVAFGDQVVPSQRMSVIDDSVSWDGDTIKITPPTTTYRPGDLRAVVDAVRKELAHRDSDYR